MLLQNWWCQNKRTQDISRPQPRLPSYLQITHKPSWPLCISSHHWGHQHLSPRCVTGADRRLPQPFPGLVVGRCFIFPRQTAFPPFWQFPLWETSQGLSLTCTCCYAAHSLKRHLTNISLTRRKACWSSSSWSHDWDFHHWSIRREI